MKEEKTINIGGVKEAEEKKVLLSTPCEIREVTIPSFEIDLPEIVVLTLKVREGDHL